MCQCYLFLAIPCPGNGSNSQRGRWTCRRGGGGVFTSSTANLPLHPSHPWTLQPPAAPWLRGDLAPVTHPWASTPPWARIQKGARAQSNLLCCQQGFYLVLSVLVNCPTQPTCLAHLDLCICQLSRRWKHSLALSKMFEQFLRPWNGVWVDFFLQNMYFWYINWRF